MAADDNKHEDSEKGLDPKTLFGDTFKKVFSAGISAAFMTEESIRNYLGDLKLPKDLLNLILQGASKSKDEITNRVTKEVLSLLSKVDWAKEAARFAENHKFKISAEIEIAKKPEK